ncbi:MAG: TIGR01621 family pseudouridine synthase [Bermanella sp.]
MKNIKIVYEHADWLLCYKPAGLNFHNEDGELGLVSLLREQRGTEDIWPVHRLDKPTSGLILLARSQESCSTLSQMFSKREMEKYYLAICPKTLKKKQGWVIGDMTKGRRGGFKLLKTKENPAITQFFSYGLGNGFRLCLLKPSTGKTHQLRVALKSLAAPIVGDEAYAGTEADRLYLHAYALKFCYQGQDFSFVEAPNTGEQFLLESATQQIESLSVPWDLKWPSIK